MRILRLLGALVVLPLEYRLNAQSVDVIDLSKAWEKGPLYNQNQAYCNIQSSMAPFLIEGWVIIQNGLLVAEGYDDDYSKRDLYKAFSVTKSWSTMLIGKMVELEQISIEETLGEIFSLDSDWAGVAQATEKKGITMEELLTMTGGLVSGPPEFKDQDTLQKVLNFMSFHIEQRGKFNYLGANHILSQIILRRSGLTPVQFAKQQAIFQKLGVDDGDFEWEQFGGVEGSAFGLAATPQVLAKLGQLYLQNGLAAEGDQLIPSEWIEASVTDQLSSDTESVQCLIPGYGYQWYVDRKEREGILVPVTALEGAFAAYGIRGQQLIVIPKTQTVIAIMSDDVSNAYSTVFLIVILENLKMLRSEVHNGHTCGSFSFSSFGIRSTVGLILGLLKILSNQVFE